MKSDEIQKQIEILETEMSLPDFWSNKEIAKKIIQEICVLKQKKDGAGKYDIGGATLSILSGAGGDDSEDFSRMLLHMYYKFFEKKNWHSYVLHENKNPNGGYRSITIEINGKNVYGTLKNESGVHRLVRQSPFNSKGLRHTSFSMVEVVPIIEAKEVTIRPEDIRTELSRSSGPGGQNVNKRETAVRLVHIPTNIAVHVESERSQENNKQKALEMLQAKLYKIEEEVHKAEVAGKQISKTTEIEWGNQIRSYVLHPYKMIKDHRTDIETSDVEGVLEKGNIEIFLDAEKNL